VTDAEPADMRSVSYPLRNSSDREARRLSLLQQLSDPITIEWFERLGVDTGWHCAELGAGGGSMVQWLAHRVGSTGSVTAVDRDTSQLGDMADALANVALVEGDLCEITLPEDTFDLVHSRSVVMHVSCPDHVIKAAVAALRPGGTVFFEESDGAPAESLLDPPPPYARVMVPLATRWTWARGLAQLLESLGMVDVRQVVRDDPIIGGTDQARFWKFTLGSVVELRRQGGTADPGFEEAAAAMSALLDDPSFSAPFTARHRVTARRPGG
jgi:ubiquinone/menaquinone biosynthesis C-methylase UbiE